MFMLARDRVGTQDRRHRIYESNGFPYLYNFTYTSNTLTNFGTSEIM